ncbi:TPA: NADP-dependent oxidoreductase [Aeromonas salmonicida]|uniref:NADP-dependent oxidoreductase n=1 Tax=Aeromonas salmonicida TaxID=645 RepID=UPI0005A75EE5|nr:NADP-dependent oxidoreductase [Aeromonas salmonicida]ELI6405248.1 NADP-dependent oxidoreductase [Aeromonas salmonicida subsp. salmonicida]ASI22223.1 quinone oxidoreductase [Aeromonas salmonicida]ASI26536.1 quinone oxidoreductase [Aeromonas salmonicida]ASI30657.1 quinone oxidoreductase [Aeromonas salmonicida]ATD37904.1 quinone oxidoreductase [Aeromonas salmonicida subsp. masoucida]
MDCAMTQLQITEFGDPSVLKLNPSLDKVPAEGEVRVRIYFAGVNPIDAKTRAGLGWAAAENKDKLPWTPGYDVAGVIEKVGPGVTSLVEGDLVCGMVGFPLAGGAYAESVVASEGELIKLDGVPLGQGAALPLAGLTAWQGLFEHGGLKPGQRVLILAGAGGVGHLAVQFAAADGAEVVATASRDNHSFLHSLGASQMVDYHDPDWVAQIVDHTGQVDLVLDLMGGESGKAALACVKPGGKLVTVPTITAQQIKEAAAGSGVEVLGMLVHPDSEQLANILILLRQGQVQVTVSAEFALADGGLAHQAIEEGHVRGKLLLRMPAAEHDLIGKS